MRKQQKRGAHKVQMQITPVKIKVASGSFIQRSNKRESLQISELKKMLASFSNHGIINLKQVNKGGFVQAASQDRNLYYGVEIIR